MRRSSSTSRRRLETAHAPSPARGAGLRSSDHAIAPIIATPASSAAHSHVDRDVGTAGSGADADAAEGTIAAAASGVTWALAAGSAASAARPGINASSDIGALLPPAFARTSANGPAPRATKISWRRCTPMRIVGAAWPSWLIGPKVSRRSACQIVSSRRNGGECRSGAPDGCDSQ